MTKDGEKTPIGTVLLLILVCSVVGIAASSTVAKPPILANAQDTSRKLVNKQDLNSFDQVLVNFSSQVLLNRSFAEVSFPIAFNQEIPILWLSADSETEEAKVADILISHPELWNLNWKYLRDGNLVLYQKESRFQSVAEFLSSDINLENLAADPFIKNDLLPELKEAFSTNDRLDLENLDYVLTTFIKPEEINEVYYFSRRIDIRPTARTGANEITWTFRNEAAYDQTQKSVYLMGDIHVDFKE